MNQHPGTISIEELICDETFQQYCLGQNVPSQLYWEEWIAANSHRQADVDEASRVIHILTARQGNRLEQLKQLRDGIHRSEVFKSQLQAENKPTRGSQKIRPLLKYFSGIAAAIVLVSILFLVRREKFTEPESRVSHIITGKIFKNGDSPRQTTILKDGTVVTLSRNSSLELSPEFSKSNREVWLEGEAFFDVTHDAKNSFIVHSLKNDIKVLGTIFNVQAYAHALTNETTLLKGRVEIIPHGDPHNTYVLEPNQKLITTVASGESALVDQSRLSGSGTGSGVKTAELKEVEWVRNRLDIENESLSVIAEKLEKWYGIDIVIEDEQVKTYRYSGVFENESVIKTLEALQLSYPFTFRVSENKIVINK